MEEEKLLHDNKQQDLLATTPFRNLLQVFINNQLTKDDLDKPASGLNKLNDSYINSEDERGGFLGSEEGYEPTQQEVAVIFGMQGKD
ncbi:hypothetical protein MKX03_032439 [Papaver bracteatum]|nr:hypothetical protein MKX03_032439 [Papaver bracteatum]